MTGDALRLAARILADKPSPLKPVRGSIVRILADEKVSGYFHNFPKWRQLVAVDPEMARFAHWSVATISVPTNSTASPKQCVSPVQASNHFVYSGGLEKGLRQPRSSTMHLSCLIRDATAAKCGSRRTTMVKYEARCAFAMRWRSRRTWCRFASCRRSRPTTRKTISRFGFDPKLHPRTSPWRSGWIGLTMDMAGAYAVFTKRWLSHQAILHPTHYGR